MQDRSKIMCIPPPPPVFPPARVFPLNLDDSMLCLLEICMAQVAGGQVLQHEGGKAGEPRSDVRYNKEDPLNPFFVVYGTRKAAPAL